MLIYSEGSWGVLPELIIKICPAEICSGKKICPTQDVESYIFDSAGGTRREAGALV